MTKLSVRLGLVALCSFIGACLTFPGLRLAQTHLDALKMVADRPLIQLCNRFLLDFEGRCYSRKSRDKPLWECILNHSIQNMEFLGF